MIPETFHRATKELANRGLVRFTGQNLELPDLELLLETI
jgi:hypothetical protein